MRPCTCDKCDKSGPYQPGECRVCWLFLNDPRYRELFTFGVQPKNRPAGTCGVRRGPVRRE
jgi:hypothetical protein